MAEPHQAELRELRESDAEGVSALFAAAYGEDRTVDAEEVRSWLRNEELQRDWLRVLVEDGKVVGYGDIWPSGGHLAVDVAAPGRWEVFLDWAEAHARSAGIPHVRVYVPSGSEPTALLEARGYHVWRSSYELEIELAAPPARPVLADGIEVRTYRAEDAEALRASLNEAFAEDPFWQEVSPSNFREFYLRARGFDPSLWLLAWSGEELAGSVLAFPERAGDTTLGWVGTLSVRKPWRRGGLGTALLVTAFCELYDRGLRRAGLGVDAENVTGALRVYERAGMRRVRQSDNWVLAVSPEAGA